ncbi:hypothetical protein DL765_003693 [Monosporascus sp. GIB2]|nr:hypothetical protein DL765_003693 [Monosporascus sp. GIB2]
MSHPAAANKWDRYKNEIYTLYITKDLPLEGPDGVREVMRQRFGFDASKAQYEYRLKKWDFRKYLKGTQSKDFQIVLRKFESAKARLVNMGKEPRVYYRGKLVTGKVLRTRGHMTYLERNTLEQDTAGLQHLHIVPFSHIRHGLSHQPYGKEYTAFIETFSSNTYPGAYTGAGFSTQPSGDVWDASLLSRFVEP